MGMEVTGASMKELKWKKINVSESLLTLMDDTVMQLSQMRNEQFQRVTHLFGKMYVATIDDLVIFRAGTRTRPSIVTAIAFDQNADGMMFVLDNPDDIHACCDYLGIEEQRERRAFFDFVTPSSKQ